MQQTYEAQYQSELESRDRHGLVQLGIKNSCLWHDDPKLLGIVLARYKFVAKMFEGMESVLEVGCGDAFGTRIVEQVVSLVVATDADPIFINDAIERNKVFERRSPLIVHNILSGPVIADSFDGAYALDVLEHIQQAQENTFVANIAASLKPHGACIIGTPSAESQSYASPRSKAGHVNCKSGPALAALMRRYFENVFLFGMNDETLHTGFAPMCHYRFALATGGK